MNFLCGIVYEAEFFFFEEQLNVFYHVDASQYNLYLSQSIFGWARSISEDAVVWTSTRATTKNA